MTRINLLFLIAIFVAPVQVSRAQTVTLDRAIKESAAAFSANLEPKTVIAVWSIESGYPDLSNYIIEELSAGIVGQGKLTMVERRKLEALRQEQNYQVSGMVSEATMAMIGQQLGAGVVIAGSFTVLENQFRLRLTALKVETAEIMRNEEVGMRNEVVVTKPFLIPHSYFLISHF